MITLVIDTNIFFSAIYTKNGIERRILDFSIQSNKIQLFAPDIFWEEIVRNLVRKLGYTEDLVNQIISEFEIIKVSQKEYEKFMNKAKTLINHRNDLPFVSTSLLLNCPVWSGNINHFEKLKKSRDIVWFSTKALLKYLKKKDILT